MTLKSGLDVLETPTFVNSWAVFFFKCVVLAEDGERVWGGGTALPGVSPAVMCNESASLKILREMGVFLHLNTTNAVVVLLVAVSVA